MERIAMTDGSGRWFDKEKAECFEEDSNWDGSNSVSKATGSKTEHEVLYKTAGGNWVLNCWSQWQGTTETWEIVSESVAVEWMLTNGHGLDLEALGLGEQAKELEV